MPFRFYSGSGCSPSLMIFFSILYRSHTLPRSIQVEKAGIPLFIIARTGDNLPLMVFDLTESPVLLLKEWPSRRFSIPLRLWLFFLLPLLQMPYLFSLLLLGLWVLE